MSPGIEGRLERLNTFLTALFAIEVGVKVRCLLSYQVATFIAFTCLQSFVSEGRVYISASSVLNTR